MRVGQEGERSGGLVAVLGMEPGKVNALPVEPRRRAGLEPAPLGTRTPLSDSASSRDGGSPARPDGRCSGPMWTRPLRNVPVVTTSAGHVKRSPVFELETDHAAGISQDAAGLPEDPVDVRNGLQRALHPGAVAPLVRLRARRPDRRTAAPVEQLELDAGRVDRAAHQAAERVDLADQVPLGRAADCRIARHVGDGAVRQRANPDAAAQTRGGPRRFHACVPRADDDHVEVRVT